ncbi:serine/threonine-protein kinase Chk1 [Brienomyrus brachyistius]|uniref:serine/threonine-protein kinase Chk1 n=1 Tax=Brienomyrus brachyistius TaxID=42636 RepID=UPI0020B1B1EC|nr:serine/threonine-protein kinase Chk1 [Brienomyrus brachyistius]XP_048840578.1 serine/threonine-protein kinase Chk1 [Brienomyrus brachyistius]XP_048840579.1 serine/threonine-protein kinase Chk1 [Brienomyrus brachyistius]XP_048840580.1 serine/threonine-protein kinase Chk1 [Brienomyrus brachyistius]XP_048840581.1 serine/threonine-protein kinase Chk1 [Brienomyrus brachyistius]
MAVPFVQDWDLVQTLGEGAYGEVRLLVNRKTEEAVAVKVVDTSRAEDCSENVKKEVCINKLLSHPNIVRFFGHRREGHTQYLFLEYCSGGELFDRIEPDVGMPEKDAQRFFQQLIAGVEYLHSVGITHRDIKPENILLDDKDNLKISDFGLATMFRHRGRERKLTRLCGTLPYVAPELMSRMEFSAQPADVWSCGIVLTAMLAGELPWDQPIETCQEYSDWLQRKTYITPWKKIDALPLSVLTRILLHDAEKRITIPDIKKDRWFSKSFKTVVKRQCDSQRPAAKLLRSDSEQTPFSREGSEDRVQISSSQPEPTLSLPFWESNVSHVLMDAPQVSFSQPACPDHMLLGSQLLGTPGSSQSPWQRLVRRMTRFFTTLGAEQSIAALTDACVSLGYKWKQNCINQITVCTMDRRNNKLIFKVHFLEMEERILVDFRLSKGDGLEFKRHFLKMKRHLCDIISNVKVPLPMT